MSVNPFVRQLGLQAVLDRDSAPPPPTQDLEGERVESALAGHVRLAWQRNKIAKTLIDQKLLECLRARRGVYSGAALAQMQERGAVNIVWADLTEAKCRAASAWVREVVLPVGEQPWDISPTPQPDLPAPIKKGIVSKAVEQAVQVMQQTAQAGGGVLDRGEFRDLAVQLGEKLRDDAEKAYTKAAATRARRMSATIADRLTEGGYYEAMDAFIEDFVTYPAAILKGPFYKRHQKLSWGDGFKPKVTNEAVPSWAHVSPFDAYPAPGSTNPQHGDFIERLRFRRDELHDCKGLPGYKDDQIDGALRDYSSGHLEGWMWTEAERQRLTQETLYMWLSPPGVIDALNYWGSVPGWKLMSWGVEGDLDETREYECNVVVCGSYVLYATLNPDPLRRRPYRKACYDEMPGAFWGRSIPDLCRTSQQMCNATLCSLADNMSVASGPQFWVHADRLADGEQTMEVFPMKIWQLKSDATQGVNPGIGTFDVKMYSAELLSVYEKFKIESDDSTGIPRYTYGNEKVGGGGDTLGGLSILMNNAAKGLRRGISNIDLNVIGPTIVDTFTTEMIYNPDDSIKGDCVVVPRGAAAILVREAAQQRRIQFLGMTANPVDAQILGAKYRANLLRETAAAMELPVDEVVPSDDEVEAQQQAQAQAAQAQAEQEKAQHQEQLQLELEKERLIADREAAARSDGAMADIVKQAVQAALAQQTAAPKSKKIKYQYDDNGALIGGELE